MTRRLNHVAKAQVSLPNVHEKATAAGKAGARAHPPALTKTGARLMRDYAVLPGRIKEALAQIEPSHDGNLDYYPCKVLLKDGRVFDTVYLEPEKPYLDRWGVYPEDDPAKLCLA